MWLCSVIKVFLTNTSKAKHLLYQRHKKSGVKMVVIALLVSGKRELFFIYQQAERKMLQARRIAVMMFGVGKIIRTWPL
jgi:hypothetical protein